MSAAPLLSFIVLSYNYEDYIGITLRSILDQTVQDFEVVVVDDCSTDGSLAVIRGFDDPRIRLVVNERNLGGAGSYNVAVQTARGTWLVNLDADDWIVPEKSAIQLAALERSPDLDIIGSWVSLVDASGARHPQADEVEAMINQDHQLNRVESWIGQNPLCRSSTMVRREAHLRIGLDDPNMVRAPDYELWTRALAMGCRFGLVHEPLTCYRLQTRGVTHADPVGALLELGYATVRDLAPLAERRALFEAQSAMLTWFAQHQHLISLTPCQSRNLIAQLLTLPPQTDFLGFRDALSSEDTPPAFRRVGRFGLLNGKAQPPAGTVERLLSAIDAITEGREYWPRQSETWAKETHWYRSQAEAWEKEALWYRTQLEGRQGSAMVAAGPEEAGMGHPTMEIAALREDRETLGGCLSGGPSPPRQGLHQIPAGAFDQSVSTCNLSPQTMMIAAREFGRP